MFGKQVVEELGSRFHAGDQEVIAGAGARDVEQVALGSVDLVEFGVITDSATPKRSTRVALCARSRARTCSLLKLREVTGCNGPDGCHPIRRPSSRLVVAVRIVDRE